MQYLLAGGGTGGHLTPGIALAQEIRASRPDASILFAISDRPSDAEALRRYDLPSVVWGARRWTDWVDLPTFAALNAIALGRTIDHVHRLRPDVVIALGGYVAAFPAIAAVVLRRPLVMLEQNVIPGRVTRMLARQASLIGCQWPETVRRVPIQAPVVITGNPVRREILEDRAAKPSDFPGLVDGAPTVLVMGGSQGAHAINEAVPAAVPRLLRKLPQVQFLHLTGSADKLAVEGAYRRFGARACVLDYLDDMGAAYRCSDVVVSRAGGTSLAEITALGKPAILVPYPHAADDHQRHNARVLGERGAAEVIDPNQLTPDIMAARLESLLLDESARRGMSVRAKEHGRPNAASEILAHIDKLLGEQTATQKADDSRLQTAK
jgi:UDP-N-acetylglucosamine--N-acetylmuramyl-(pentapeptide) pyrophosphoryl-undecaprenol N-acetylglucosamine transferase